MSGLVATVVTHRRPEETSPAVKELIELARPAGARLLFDPSEAAKHGLTASAEVELVAEDEARAVDLCFALGGDGTILRGLRRYAGTGVPVFGVNYGEVGFLATVEREEARAAFERAFAREFDVLALPGIAVRLGERDWIAINDVSVERQHGQRVATLAYSVGEDVIGSVRCDGLVVATPAGSTGYNLANGGPVMAWGVEGMVISFIAPHSLTARALVVAPGDTLAIANRGEDESVDVVVDGRPMAHLDPGARLEARFVDNQGALAQLAGVSFYGRLHEKFGRLATLR
ncbi:MAG TPA: NAD(+)/NADH kinase [Solirubrobacteraceae bacterium]|nr:NAD(+)/NADH kinase [Solirubrobacteraceae bacterium]